MTTHYSKQFKVIVYPFLKGYVSKDGKQSIYVKLRFKSRDNRIKELPEKNIPVYNEFGDSIKVSKSEFKSNRFNIQFKNRIAEISERVEFAAHHFLSNNLKFDVNILKDFIYNNMEQSNNVKNEEYVTDKDVLEDFGLDKPEPKSLVNKLMTVKTEDFKSEADEPNDFDKEVEIKKREWFREKEKEDLETIEWEERYNRGLFDKENIFDVFGFCLTTDKRKNKPYVSSPYRSLILKLADYRFNKNPAEKISQFNKEWVDDFIIFLRNEGYITRFHPKNYNPFALDRYLDNFLTNDREFYTVSSFKKAIKHLKAYIEVLQENGFISRSQIDTRDIKASNYLSNDTNSAFTRNNHYLIETELEKMLNTSFKNKRLDKARTMFLLQVFAGGLRNEEFFNKNFKIKGVGNERYISFYASKVDETNENPLIKGYTDVLLNQIDYKINDDFLPENEYREALKEVATGLNLNREIRYKRTMVNDNRSEVIDTPISKLINPYMARKTFVRFGKSLGMVNEQIMSFTGHKKTDTLRHYFNDLSLEDKNKIINKK